MVTELRSRVCAHVSVLTFMYVHVQQGVEPPGLVCREPQCAKVKLGNPGDAHRGLQCAILKFGCPYGWVQHGSREQRGAMIWRVGGTWIVFQMVAVCGAGAEMVQGCKDGASDMHVSLWDM